MKNRLRDWVKEERKKLDINLLSEKLVFKLKETDEYRLAKNIMFYYPMKYEINLLALLEDKSKNFYLPKIDGKNLQCCPYNADTKLSESCFRTKEPLSKPIKKDLLDLVIVPALAVDEKNYRLGYGGGFYDRFLKDIDCKKIACLSEKFCLDTIFPEIYDIRVDKVITA